MENSEQQNTVPAPQFRPPGCGVLLLLIVVVLLTISYFKCEAPVKIENQEIVDVSPTVIKQLQIRKEWCFREIAMEETSEIKGITGSLLKRYYGVMRLGVKLDSINENYVQFYKNEQVLTIQLPKIEVLDDNFIDETKTETLVENAWTKFNNEELKRCFNQAKRKMIENNFTTKNIELAEDQGKTEIKRLVKSSGYSGKIEVEFIK
ncbi:MAG: DUF4230 domain-containing protein [Bacteroidales bacterium]|nr:DUF4230 domain-containing protein [Bacteroidales bacterium]